MAGQRKRVTDTIFRTFAIQDKYVITRKDLYSIANSFSKPSSTIPFDEINSLQEAVDSFEKNILKNLYIEFSSTRKLANRLGVCNATISIK